MENKELVSILLTTRNRENDILECLDSIYNQSYQQFEIIIVDNASQDNTVSAIKSKYPKVILVEAQRNYGIAGGRNIAQEKAVGKYLLFLDSDTVLHQHFINELAGYLKRNAEVGMVVPKMYYFDKPDYIWFAGSSINLKTSRTLNEGAHEKDVGQYDEPKKCAHGPTAFMVTSEVAKLVKGHDESYFMTYADADYAIRTQKAGFDIYYVPTAKLWHRLDFVENTRGIRRLGYNIPLRAYYFSRNRVLFMKKNSDRLNFMGFMFLYFPLYTLYYTVKIIQYRGKWVHLKNHLIGSWDGIKYALLGKSDNNHFV